jgi:hypothetical protein
METSLTEIKVKGECLEFCFARLQSAMSDGDPNVWSNYTASVSRQESMPRIIIGCETLRARLRFRD